ncbi:hypothetical protein [Apilactobacillus bombintestini]|uniref:Uncharacterized protein n=1 Tax=Apilactobacillus bombintestini TaxID=2419772 RepID=A0A387ATM7_9LACO|nr:hypothetical protein [Apilactobacillus bombintestini]AYF92699.1 hypothetical protein D7I45_04005 [Apilactobacillus bombintestini]
MISGLAMGIIGTSIYLRRKMKHTQRLNKINLQVKHAKNSLNTDHIYGSWIKKSSISNNYVGAINVLENNKIVEHFFKIRPDYSFSWISNIKED